jgi:hypothetical protein
MNGMSHLNTMLKQREVRQAAHAEAAVRQAQAILSNAPVKAA